MKTSGRRPKKYGQVYLSDPETAKFEVEILRLRPGETVLEIGPGHGEITAFLLQEGVSVAAVEADHTSVEFLLEKFPDEVASGRLTVLHASFLDLEGGEYSAIIGNIPYHITSAIIFSLDRFKFDRAVLMIQKEVADRILALPGSSDYSRLTVNCAFRYSVERKRDVPASKFTPVPRVDSSIIFLTRRGKVEIAELQRIDSVVRKAFSMRRKKIGTVFGNVPEKYSELRAEDLTPEDFIELASSLLGTRSGI